MVLPRAAATLLVCFPVLYAASAAAPERSLSLELSPPYAPLNVTTGSDGDPASEVGYWATFNLTITYTGPPSPGYSTLYVGALTPDGQRYVGLHRIFLESSAGSGRITLGQPWEVSPEGLAPGSNPVIFQAFLGERPEVTAAAMGFVNVENPAHLRWLAPSIREESAEPATLLLPGVVTLTLVGGGGLIAATLARRSGRPFFFLAAFTRIPKERLLENETRRRIHDAVSRTPYVHRTELQLLLGLPRYALRHHLGALVRARMVCEEGRRASRSYFLPRDRRKDGRGSLTPRQREVSGVLARKGTATAAHIARELGMTKGAVRQHLAALARKGWAERVDPAGDEPVTWRAIPGPGAPPPKSL